MGAELVCPVTDRQATGCFLSTRYAQRRSIMRVKIKHVCSAESGPTSVTKAKPKHVIFIALPKTA